MLTEFYEEIQPKLQALDYPPLDIPFWIEDFWHHADEYLPPAGSTWIARNAAGLAVGSGTMGWAHLLCDTIRTNIEMQTLYQSMGFRFTGPYPESCTVRADPKGATVLVCTQLDL
ncbi:hypothetical protein [Pseudotabrizicola sediminis]|uniref:hypothetical protein n=1 Tax=Pseudotabrizicola sediminis TaxID=2486418 RepID=UPI001436B6AF|nr:hypothetical protein [Pseudotabrizicola sediminis]